MAEKSPRTAEQALFSEEMFVATRQPVERAFTMPGACYTSPEWYEREIENIFLREWICVGRAEEVPNAGDYFTVDVVGEPIVVVRDRDGLIYAHSAVCRHRGTNLVSGFGNCKAFRCPYHNWTYSLAGELLATPGHPDPMKETEDFSKSEYGLIGVRLEQWGGFVFVNFDSQAPSLGSWLGDLGSRVANYKLEEMALTQGADYVVDCNWKVYVENANEGYHIPAVHKSMKVDGPRNWTYEESGGPYQVQYVVNSISELRGFPEMEGLSERELKGTYFIWVRPTLFLVLTPTYMRYRLHFPEGPERVRLVENWCFTQAIISRPDFQEKVERLYYEPYMEIAQQDLELAPLVQKGLRSRLYRRGRYACPEETMVHRSVTYVIERVLGLNGPPITKQGG